LRKQGKWTLTDSRLKVINNFDRKLGKILKRAGVKNATFHDLRSTAITNWFRQGLKELEVMRLAGHSSFATTHQFYLAVADDLVDRARQAVATGFGDFLARTWRAPSLVENNG
jgi:integrase